MSYFIHILLSILPPPRWRLPVLALIGTMTGIGSVIIYQSRAWSYLLDDPSACINCHIMIPQYTTWQHSSHARVATCNDCHVPHDNILHKYFFKAKDGTRHATLFTLRMEDQVIQITDPSKKVVQMNCVRCHSFVNDDVHTKLTLKEIQQGEGKFCWECHREVPHGRVNSLSSVPNAKAQLDTPNLPAWLRLNPKENQNDSEKYHQH